MKKFKNFLPAISFIGCHAINTTALIKHLKAFIYAQFEHEFAKVEDTLILQKLNDNYYKIVQAFGCDQ